MEQWERDQMVEDFFDLSSTRKYYKPQPIVMVPIEKLSEPAQNRQREDAGTEYARVFKAKSSKCVAANFSKLNITSQLTNPSFDLSTTIATESNATLIDNYSSDLPIYKSREEIVRKISESPIVIINGLTGSGKSTQVPQYIFDSHKAHNKQCNIVISQPRRIAAITLAQRVSEERNTPLGQEIGYQVSLDKNVHERTNEKGENVKFNGILFCTTGVILRKLIYEKSMNRYTHIIIDEIHERSIEVDFLLIVIRRLMALQVCHTKIILMSASMDIKQFVDLFQLDLEDGSKFEPQVIDIMASRRNYKIEKFYLDSFSSRFFSKCANLIDYKDPGISDEMYEFAGKIIIYFLRQLEELKQNDTISSRNTNYSTILVFLPGVYEIEKFQQTLLDPSLIAMNVLSKKPDILLLHSMLSTDQQKAAFSSMGDKPKIILATNIAESSVTIPNVTHVIDFCLTKFNAKVKGARISSLVLDWASKNNCLQRAGRTGRVCDGIVVRLVSAEFYEKSMKAFPAPDMQRVSLESVVIGLKELNMGSPLELLALAVDPPNKSSIVDSVLFLKELGALERFNSKGDFVYDDGDITYMGKIMASLPLDVHLSKMIIVGYMFGVLDEAIIMAAGLSLKSIFINDCNRKIISYVNKLNWARGSQSDCLALLSAYKYWDINHTGSTTLTREAERRWCNRHGLEQKNLKEMRLLIEEIKSRLISLGITNNEKDVETLKSKDKLFIMKIVLAGAFGSSNFFIPLENSEYLEREAFTTINNNDLFQTVFFTNMDFQLIGEVYEDQLRKILKMKGIIDDHTKLDIVFDNPVSQKIYVTFKNNKAQRESEESYDNFSRNCVINYQNGRIIPEVYKAVKNRQLQNSVTLNVMNHEETIEYAVEMGLGNVVEGHYKKTETLIEYPEYVSEPTNATFKMHGKVTSVETCSKFFFMPVRSFGPGPDQVDERYAENQEYLKALKSYKRNPTTIAMLKADKLVVVNIAKVLERGFVKGISSDNKVEVYLIDRGEVAKIDQANVFVMEDQEIENIMKAVPPLIFECTLTELQPAAIGSVNGKWSEQAIALMSKAVVGRKVSIRIYSVVDGIASVQLNVKSVDWNQKLLDEGFADDCEESYLSKINHEIRLARQTEINKLNDPKKEFANRVQKGAKALGVPAPPISRCKKFLRLKGPFSPLEIKLKSISRTCSLKLTVDSLSVNSVLLNDDLLNFSTVGKFCVACDVTVSPDCRTMTLRETTIMPNIPGLAVLVGLIFSPTAELRRNETNTRYQSVLTGLGFDKNRKQPFYGERDAVLDVDFELTVEDLEQINTLRFYLSKLWMTDSTKKAPRLFGNQKEETLKKIRKIAFEIFYKKRQVFPAIDISGSLQNIFDWKESSTIGNNNQTIFSHIPIPQLEASSDKMCNDLKEHIEDLLNCSRSRLNMKVKVCKICNFYWETETELQVHMLSKKHITQSNRIMKSTGASDVV